MLFMHLTLPRGDLMKRLLLITLILAILLCSYIIPAISAEGIQYLQLTIPSSGGVRLSMQLIQEGSFLMGSPQIMIFLRYPGTG